MTQEKSRSSDEMQLEKKFTSGDRTIFFFVGKLFFCQIVISEYGRIRATEDFVCPHSASKRYEYLKGLME